MVREENKKGFLNKELIKQFREVINSSNTFCDVPEYQTLWNLICVLLDRLESAVDYLNAHSNQPETEEELVFFMVYASMLKDGIYKFYENIYHTKPRTIESKRWFSNAHTYSQPIFTEENCPTDDTFFEYFRALSFAHPYEVSKRAGRLFMENDEIHLSPWVISNCLIGKERDDIGFRLYSNKDDGLKDVFVRFKDLKGYLAQRYRYLYTFIKWGNEEIIKQNNIWMQEKVCREGTSSEILENIIKILDKRYCSHYSIDEALSILNSNFNDAKNNKALEIVKNLIHQHINQICDCVDKLDYENMEESLNFLYERPENLHDHAHYELEKIFDYLGDGRGPCLRGSNEEWGLIQAINFYEAYAKKYVNIDFQKMSFSDIKTLIRISCVLGVFKEQKTK
ncbi:MAG: hypothetical protein MJ217_02920 [Bacilli bacterium]|nr:hypothetical protein [Bacilli bacterium]